MRRHGVPRRPLPLMAAAAVVAALTLALAAPQAAQAGSVSAGGWTASWSDALDDVLGLTVSAENGEVVRFAKTAVFNENRRDGLFVEPLVITFQQTSADAASSVVIEEESVTNNTGVEWIGFDFILTPPAASGLSFNETETFGGADPFDVAPFEDWEFTDGGKRLSLSDGTVASGAVWEPGVASGALWINAAPLESGNRAFELKEQPIPIPLPPAVLTGLGMLGLMGMVRRLRKA